MLLLFSGLPGSGKTTMARACSQRLQALHLNSDLLRGELNLRGQYRPEDKETVYRMLLERTGEALKEGKTVIVDSTFYKESIREPFRSLAASQHSPFCWIEVWAKEDTIRERLQTPRPDSEADFSVYEKIREQYEVIPEPHLLCWTDELPLEKNVDLIVFYVEAARKKYSSMK